MQHECLRGRDYMSFYEKNEIIMSDTVRGFNIVVVITLAISFKSTR